MTTKTRRPKGETQFPLVLTERGVTARIYKSSQEKAGKTYVSFWLVWQTPEGRQRRSFADLQEAKNEAGRVLADVISGRNTASEVSRSDAELLALAQKRAGEIGRPLLGLLDEVKAALAVLDGKTTLLAAAQQWVKRNASIKPIMVHDAVTGFLADKRKAKRSESYLKELRIRLTAFAGAFQMHVHQVDRTGLRQWLDKASRSSVDRNKRLAAVSTLLTWCAERDHVSSDDAADAVRITRDRTGNGQHVEIYSPAELRQILFGDAEKQVGPIAPELLPVVVLGAFAGIRPEGELSRLAWEDVRFADRIIEVKGQKAKTASRRIIPINDTLHAWMVPYANRKGPITTLTDVGRSLKRRCAAVGVPFRRNGFRHSYGSYRLPVLKSAAELALEMGNSAAMVFSHYRELVTPAAVAEFWAILPAPAEGNLISIAG